MTNTPETETPETASPDTETETAQAKPHPRRRTSTKTAELLRLLGGKTARDITYLSEKLGWQAHTTRAALTRLRQAGYEISTEKAPGKPTRYRLVAQPAPEASE